MAWYSAVLKSRHAAFEDMINITESSVTFHWQVYWNSEHWVFSAVEKITLLFIKIYWETIKLWELKSSTRCDFDQVFRVLIKHQRVAVFGLLIPTNIPKDESYFETNLVIFCLYSSHFIHCTQMYFRVILHGLPQSFQCE